VGSVLDLPFPERDVAEPGFEVGPTHGLSACSSGRRRAPPSRGLREHTSTDSMVGGLFAKGSTVVDASGDAHFLSDDPALFRPAMYSR
jgi:hypothetical protein